MKIDRMTRVNELLKREIGEVLYKVVHENGVDLSTITITHVIASSSLRNARVLVSIRGTDEVKKKFLKVLKKHRVEFQSEINSHLKLKYTPRLTFALDSSLESGAQMLELLAGLDTGPAVEEDAKVEMPEETDR